MNVRGINIEKDPSINKLTQDVFSKLDKIANPVGKKQKPTGFGSISVEDAIKELIEMEKKMKSTSNSQ